MITIDGKTGEVLQHEGSIAELQQGKSEGGCVIPEELEPIAALVKIGFQLLAGQLLNHTLKVAPGQLPAKPNRRKRGRRNPARG